MTAGRFASFRLLPVICSLELNYYHALKDPDMPVKMCKPTDATKPGTSRHGNNTYICILPAIKNSSDNSVS